MAADSAPRDRMAYAIGRVQTAQRLGPALGPVIGGAVAQLVGLRRAFLVTSAFYLAAFVLMLTTYKERRAQTFKDDNPNERVTFRNVLAFENFILLLAVVFGLQFVDRSFGPVLPLFIAELGAPLDAVPILSGVVFSITAGTGAIGNNLASHLLRHTSVRALIAGCAALASLGTLTYVIAGGTGVLLIGAAIFGLAIGCAQTAAYTAAGSIIPAGARGAGFGLLTTASLTGLALSPIANGLLGTLSLRAVFILDTFALLLLAGVVRRLMVTTPLVPTPPPATEEV
jgi:DHA1 family multidrug resistance protein-like MFS transporter